MKQPEDFEQYDEEIMSNFDHVINQETVQAIKGKKFWAAYPGSAFYGHVWFNDNLWYCDVWVYGSVSRTMSDETIEGLKEKICYEYGRQ